ncbi:PTS sugar transporter subunit IIBC [[Clostridium] dakarense]|uniref:PTS sugar transporter subunit IIBC n=1 Tax=Faecalimicrobium dakarense TaxID=1301100 RepID=UPI0004B3A4F0|nr:PTS sugar transporter subunit IIBC [[Clostridium] dakarense]
MNKSIVAVCENEACANALIEGGEALGVNIRTEVQNGSSIINELSIEEIKSSIAVLFVIDGTVEDIEKIERFIDFEYYEVEPKFVINDPKAVINEIVLDIN